MSVRRRIGRLLWRTHHWVYGRTGGRLGGRVVGMPVLLLTTEGRYSGRPHTVPLTYLQDGQNFVVIASNGGARRDPDWYANLRAHSRASVQVGARTIRVNSRDASGDDRQRLWTRVVDGYRGYAAYQQRTTRKIPVVLLEPED